MNFNVSSTEARIISKIAQRACEVFPEGDQMTFEMDLTVTHANGCPLKLEELLVADEFNFRHDVAGIYNHLDRKTGKLKDCFSPRYSAHDPH